MSLVAIWRVRWPFGGSDGHLVGLVAIVLGLVAIWWVWWPCLVGLVAT